MKVVENNFVFYHEQDAIFNLSDEIPRDEVDFSSTECNNCIKYNAKLKNW
jgi:hypothetical protein